MPPGSQGRAAGVAPGGPIVINATAPLSLGGTITGTAQLSVTAARLVALTVIPPNAQLAQGTTQAFTATGLFTDSSTQDSHPPGDLAIVGCGHRDHQQCGRQSGTCHWASAWRPHRHQSDRAPESGRHDHRNDAAQRPGTTEPGTSAHGPGH